MSVLPLHVTGNTLLDSNNTQVTLRGMCQIGLTYACLYDPSGSTSDHWTFSLPVDDPATAAMVRWGINCVRLNICPECWLHIAQPGQTVYTYGTVYKTNIVNYVNRLAAVGIYTIINMFTTLNLLSSPSWNAYGYMPSDPEGVNFWASCAAVFAGFPSVIFEPVNEPTIGYIVADWVAWRDGASSGGPSPYNMNGMQTLINTIRAAGGYQPCILDGVGYATDLSGWLAHVPTEASGGLGLLAGWHKYKTQDKLVNNSPVQYFSDISAIAQQYPVMLTEFGTQVVAQGNPFLWLDWESSLLAFCDKYNISYMPYAWA